LLRKSARSKGSLDTLYPIMMSLLC
jgi:hypothetical protein